MNWLDYINEELDRREQVQHEFHGKSDSEHLLFAQWLLEQFDKREQH